MDWIDVAQDKEEWRALHIHHHQSSDAGKIDQLVAYVPSGLSRGSCTTGGFSRRAQLHEASSVSLVMLKYRVKPSSSVTSVEQYTTQVSTLVYI
jgi:hypothetical protein